MEPAAELAEIDNRWKTERLPTLDKAQLLARRRHVYYKLHPNALTQGGDRRGWNFKKKKLDVGFVQATIGKYGISATSVRTMVRLADQLYEQERIKAKHPSIRNNGAELELLSRQTAKVQEDILEMIENNEAYSVKHACALL